MSDNEMRKWRIKIKQIAGPPATEETDLEDIAHNMFSYVWDTDCDTETDCETEVLRETPHTMPPPTPPSLIIPIQAWQEDPHMTQVVELLPDDEEFLLTRQEEGQLLPDLTWSLADANAGCLEKKD